MKWFSLPAMSFNVNVIVTQCSREKAQIANVTNVIYKCNKVKFSRLELNQSLGVQAVWDVHVPPSERFCGFY